LSLGRRFERGTLLVVEFPELLEHPARVHLARVVRTALHPDGRWVLGCALTRDLDCEDVQALTDGSTGGDPPSQLPE
jgi:hypothetical protein